MDNNAGSRATTYAKITSHTGDLLHIAGDVYEVVDERLVSFPHSKTMKNISYVSVRVRDA